FTNRSSLFNYLLPTPDLHPFPTRRSSDLAIDSTAGATHTVEPVIVPDTGSLPAVGHSRLRIASYAPGAPPIDAWRTQPGAVGLEIGRAHVLTPVTWPSRMPSSA